MNPTQCLFIVICVLSGITPLTRAAFYEVPGTNITLEYEISGDPGGEYATVIDCNIWAEGDLTIPDSIAGYTVTSIRDHAFLNCSSLTSVTIPDSITNIPASLFDSCYSLSSVTIPESVTSIGDEAFIYCYSLASITIPDGVTTIGSSAFFYCSSLTSVTIPDSVITIGHSAFNSCFSLTSVTIGDSVTSIDDWTFSYCNSLDSVTIGNSVTSIEKYAFKGCTSLIRITIPDGVTSIESWAFENCRLLANVTIGNGLTRIDKWAFAYCSSLASIMVDADNPKYSSTDGVLYNKTRTELITYPAGKADTFVIPENVTSIGGSAFFNCPTIINVTIPESVTSISGSAFFGCTALTKVTFEGDAPDSFGDDAFSGADDGFTIYFLEGADGFTTPTWRGYPTEELTRVLALDGDLAFGAITVGQSTTVVLTIANTGNSALTISGITYPAGFSGDWSGGVIAPKASQEITVTFTPTKSGSYGGDLIIESDKTSGLYSWKITGNGVAPEPESPLPPSLRNATDFGVGYYLSSWLGGFFKTDNDASNTYIYTMDFGWTYVSPSGTVDGVWWWSFNMNSWLWGSEATGRFFYRYSDGVWIYVESYPEGGSFINNTATGEWSYLAP